MNKYTCVTFSTHYKCGPPINPTHANCVDLKHLCGYQPMESLCQDIYVWSQQQMTCQWMKLTWQMPEVIISPARYYLSHVCHTMVPEINVYTPWNAPCIIDMLACVIYKLTEQQERSSAMKIVNEDRKATVQTHGINEFSLMRHWQWSCSWPATCQRTCVTRKQPMGCWTMLLCDFHNIIGVTLNLLQCLHVFRGCRA